MSASERFHNTVLEFLDTISSCVEDLAYKGMTKLTTFQLTAAKAYLEKFPSAKLLLSFVDNHSTWKSIEKRDVKFITEQVPILYKDTGMDVAILTCPFECYARYGAKSPVTAEDISIIWEYFETMVRVACNFVFNERRRTQGYMSSIDLDHYTRSFHFELILD